MNPKAIGELSEAIVLVHLMKRGWAVSLPFGNNQRYDLVVDVGERLLRAQVKTAHEVKGGIMFAVVSKNGFTGARTGYEGQIDVFLAQYDGRVFMVPVEDVPGNSMTLRFDPPKPRGNFTAVNWAKDYELLP